MRSDAFLVTVAWRRRAFAAWSIEVPSSFAETFVQEDRYWHAWDENRSVSLTSLVLTDHGRPVSVERLVRRMPLLDGTPVEELPFGLSGRAFVGPTTAPARASMALTGLLAANGRLLLVTITSDDVAWARATWCSIRGHPTTV